MNTVSFGLFDRREGQQPVNRLEIFRRAGRDGALIVDGDQLRRCGVEIAVHTARGTEPDGGELERRLLIGVEPFLRGDHCRVPYAAVPKRDRIAAIVCCRVHVRREPCKPLCRRCLETAYEIKMELLAEPDWWGDRGRYDGGGR